MKASIKSKIRNTILLNVFFTGVVITAVTCLIINHYAVENHKVLAKSFAASYALTISEAVSSVKNQLHSVASNNQIFDGNIPLEDRQSYLKVQTRNTAFRRFTVADKRGNTLEQKNVEDQAFFQNAMQGVAFLSAPRPSSDGTMVIDAGAEITALGMTGIVAGELEGDFFTRYTAHIALGKTGYGFILDSEGRFVAHADASLLGTQAIEQSGMESVVSQMALGQPGEAIFAQDGIKRYVSFCPIDGAEGWTLAVCQNYDEIVAASHGAIRITVVVLAAVVAFSFAASAFAAKAVSHPISAAVGRLEQLALGDLTAPIPSRSNLRETNTLLDALQTTIHSMQSYVQDIAYVLRHIALGNLQVRSQQEYSGDFLPIQGSLHDILSALGSIFSDVKNAAFSVQANAEQVMAGSAQISDHAAQEADTITQLNGMIVEIEQGAKDNAQNAAHAEELFSQMTSSSQRAQADMHNTLAAVKEIEQNAHKMQRIIQIIDDIAFQTNILALNASVEAARAGASGAGFAVVANEVRTLALKSAQAAKDTEALIRMTEGSIRDGRVYASQSMQSLSDVSARIEQAESIMIGISHASTRQANAVSGIRAGVTQISQTILSNTAFAEECAAVSQSLNAQASLLAQKLARFQCGADVTKPASSTPILSAETAEVQFSSTI